MATQNTNAPQRPCYKLTMSAPWAWYLASKTCQMGKPKSTVPKRLRQKYAIHGLWLCREPKHAVTSEVFSAGMFQHVRAKLLKKMPNFDNYVDPEAGWEKQWDKHGCRTGMGVKDYFETILRLSQANRLTSAIKKIGKANLFNIN